MSEYITKNRSYYVNVYPIEHVEGIIVRTYHKYLKPELAKAGITKPKLLDFGCGTGTPTRFFHNLGMDAYGVDFSTEMIDYAKKRFPDQADKFAVCDGAPRGTDIWFGGQFDVIFAMQSLYYYNETDTMMRMVSIGNMLKPGGLIWASMMASTHNWYGRSRPHEHGLRKVPSGEGAIPSSFGDHYINFTDSPEHLKQKFAMFAPIFIGYYDHDVGEGSTKHWLFIGRKL